MTTKYAQLDLRDQHRVISSEKLFHDMRLDVFSFRVTSCVSFCTSAVAFAMRSLIVACILESANVLTPWLRYRGKACQTWSRLKIRVGIEVVRTQKQIILHARVSMSEPR
jgi:hypothetical protein